MSKITVFEFLLGRYGVGIEIVIFGIQPFSLKGKSYVCYMLMDLKIDSSVFILIKCEIYFIWQRIKIMCF